MPDLLKILFIGSNPSIRAADNTAFGSDTASGRIVRSWAEGIEGTLYFENIMPLKTENNRPLKKSEMAHASASLLERIKEINPDRLVALGKSAAAVLRNLDLRFLELPHPSGMNRKLNDKKYTAEKIVDLKLYCK